MKKLISILFFLFLIQNIYPTKNFKNIYDEISEFTKNELIAVKKNRKWGVVNRDGELLTPLKYDNIREFDDEFVLVNIDDTTSDSNYNSYWRGKWGLLNKNGEEITPIKYSRIEKFGFESRISSDDEFIFINIDDGKLADGYTNLYWRGKWGLINREGREIVPAKYDIILNFSDGLAPVNIGVNGMGERGGSGKNIAYYGGKWGFIDRDGREAIPLKYNDVEHFHDGVAAIIYKNKIGFINKMGREIIPPIYDGDPWSFDYQNFSDGVIKLKLNGKWGFVDKNGKKIGDFIYDYVGNFGGGIAAVHKNKKLGFINKDGKLIVPLIYDPLYDQERDNIYDYEITSILLSEGLVSVILNDKLGFIDKSGKEIIPFIYEPFTSYENVIISYFSEGLAPVLLNGKFGFIDREGKEILPFIYDSHVCLYDYQDYCFKDGKARVHLNGKWGFIDKKGNFTLER